MIVVFKHRLEVQTWVCNSETYVCRLIVHLACHRPENIICTMMKYGETFECRHTALNTSCSYDK